MCLLNTIKTKVQNKSLSHPQVKLTAHHQIYKFKMGDCLQYLLTKIAWIST